MIDFLIIFGSMVVLLGGPLMVPLWDVLVTEPRLAARRVTGSKTSA